MIKTSGYQEWVIQLLAIDNLAKIEDFTLEEIDAMGMAAENGLNDWDADRNDARNQFKSQEEAEYSYFAATFDDVIHDNHLTN